MDLGELKRRATEWAGADPDPDDRAETRRRVEASDAAWLAEGFAARLAFGTAGMRGPLGPGPGRMNRLSVRRVTAALAGWASGREGPVVVGYDGRRGSAAFARDAAEVLARAGIPVSLSPGLCPTPHVAYAVLALGARAGIMVTASHNPPQDNGYKVYGPDGAQIVGPVDGDISARLDALPPGDPLAEPSHATPAAIAPWPDDLVDRWLAEVLALRVHRPAPLRIAYTPLHGVGAATFRRVMAEGGYTDVHVVPEQEQPDGAFPTVAFPNPEEPGALDRAKALGTAVGADLILANDPDADRIAVAVPAPGGGWRALDGNEIGTLLAEDLLSHGPTGRRLVATSVVSSQLLGRIARAHGARCAVTLTGFKWIARAGLVAAGEGYRTVLGYEEALGVSAGEVVRDKDGLSAALLFADLASHWRERGGVPAALDELASRHGLHLSAQKSWTLPGADGQARIAQVMRRLRTDPPRELGGRRVVAVVDTQAGVRTDLATGRGSPLDLPASDVLGFELEGGDRLLVRPSGTEPKLKAYVEVVEPVGDDPGGARRTAEARRGRILDAASQRILGP